MSLYELCTEKYFTAIAVWQLPDGSKVFHKYRTVRNREKSTARFQRSIYMLHSHLGKLLHVNYYGKESAKFVYQWKNNFD